MSAGISYLVHFVTILAALVYRPVVGRSAAAFLVVLLSAWTAVRVWEKSLLELQICRQRQCREVTVSFEIINRTLSSLHFNAIINLHRTTQYGQKQLEEDVIYQYKYTL